MGTKSSKARPRNTRHKPKLSQSGLVRNKKKSPSTKLEPTRLNKMIPNREGRSVNMRNMAHAIPTVDLTNRMGSESLGPGGKMRLVQPAGESPGLRTPNTTTQIIPTAMDTSDTISIARSLRVSSSLGLLATRPFLLRQSSTGGGGTKRYRCVTFSELLPFSLSSIVTTYALKYFPFTDGAFGLNRHPNCHFGCLQGFHWPSNPAKG